MTAVKRSQIERVRAAGAFLVALFVILAGYYSITTPIFEAPDELWHFDVITALAHGRFANAYGESRQEATQPPLYYALGALIWHVSPSPPSQVVLQRNPYFDYHVAGTTNKNLIYHGNAYERFPYASIARTVHLIRLLSVVFGALTILGVFRLGRLIAPARPLVAFLSAGFCAFDPQFDFLSGAITNDAAIIATSTWTLVFLAEWLRRSTNVSTVPTDASSTASSAGASDSGYLFRIALALGLALLSKATALGLAGVVGLALLRYGYSGETFIERLRRSVTVVGGATLLGGWWYVRSVILYGDPIGASVHSIALGRTTPFTLHEAIYDLFTLSLSFFARFGWTNVAPPEWVPLAFVAVSVVGLVLALRRRESWRDPITVVQLTWVGVILLLFYAWQIRIPAPQGRLIFPAIASLATLWALGITSVLDRLKRPFGYVIASGIGVTALTATAILPSAVIAPAYVPTALRLDPALPATATPAHVRFANSVELVGYDLESSSVRPGAPATITLYWRRLAPTKELSISVHLVDHSGHVVAGTDASLAPGLPAIMWPTDRTIQVVAKTKLPANVSSPQMLQVGLNVYYATKGTIHYLPIQGKSDAGAPSVMLTSLRVAKPEVTWPGGPIARFRAENGDEIDLLGWTISAATLKPGAQIHGQLIWRAPHQSKVNYTVFVHILRSGKLIAQDDSPPLGGAYTTTAWRPGEVVVDPFTVTIPPSVESGSADVTVGLYDLHTMKRMLPATGDALTLTSVEIRP